jgi:hypothetical protein
MKYCLVIALLLGIACEPWEEVNGVVCDAIVRYAISATVRDSITGVPAAGGASGRVVVGSHEEEMRHGSDDLWMGAFGNRPGQYTVIITKANYHTWRRENVTVASNSCGVITEEIEVWLQPT